MKQWKPNTPQGKAVKRAFEENPFATFSIHALRHMVRELGVSEDQAPDRLISRVVDNFVHRGHITFDHGSRTYSLSAERKGTLVGDYLGAPPKREAVPSTLSAVEAGLSIIALVDSLRNENAKLLERINELEEYTEDFQRIEQDNRVLHERVTKLSTQLSASNAAKLRF